MTEEWWAEIQNKAINEAEGISVPLTEFLEGLKIMRTELDSRIQQVESELEAE